MQYTWTVLTAMHWGTVRDFPKCCTNSWWNFFHMFLSDHASFSTRLSDTLGAQSRQLFIQNLQGFVQVCMSNFQKYDFCTQSGQTSLWTCLPLPIKFDIRSLNFLLRMLLLQRMPDSTVNCAFFTYKQHKFFLECKRIFQSRCYALKVEINLEYEAEVREIRQNSATMIHCRQSWLPMAEVCRLQQMND